MRHPDNVPRDILLQELIQSRIPSAPVDPTIDANHHSEAVLDIGNQLHLLLGKKKILSHGKLEKNWNFH